MPDSLGSVGELVLRLLLAAGAGMCVGWEREARNRPAGLRTHMLVALGACAFVLIAIQLHQQQLARGESPTWDVLSSPRWERRPPSGAGGCWARCWP